MTELPTFIDRETEGSSGLEKIGRGRKISRVPQSHMCVCLVV